MKTQNQIFPFDDFDKITVSFFSFLTSHFSFLFSS